MDNFKKIITQNNEMIYSTLKIKWTKSGFKMHEIIFLSHIHPL